MARLTAVTIHMSARGDAFAGTEHDTDREVARILRDLADDIAVGAERTILKDINGNQVGTVHLTFTED